MEKTQFITIIGEVTSTSKKQGEFANGLFSSYVSFKDEKQKEKAEAFGLPIYTSKDGETFTIIQTSRKGVKVYDRVGKVVKTAPGEIETDGVDNQNFKTTGLAGLKVSTGVNKGNKYFRLYGIVGDIEHLEGDALADIDDSELDVIDFGSNDLPF